MPLEADSRLPVGELSEEELEKICSQRELLCCERREFLPLKRFFGKLLTWAFLNSAMTETKGIFWFLLQEVLSNWNPLFVIPCLANACVF